MHAINHTVFQEIWERLTKAKFDINDGKPLFVCYICYAQLRNAHQLMKRALKSEALLTTVRNIGSEESQRTILLIASFGEDFAYKYTIAEAFQLECNEIQRDSVEEIKRENEGGEENIEEEIEIAIKEEEEDKYEKEETLDIADDESGTHSDETLPKNTLKREVRIVLEKIDIGALVRKRALKEIKLTIEIMNSQ
ncbi:hypothetical protein K1T71_014359 [Dendrolimus kikuchii]|uniref:Uncharacterized protein n=1 Tax=Dendrolimus kikuchii TaxID=765133 RepID=A0ACC1CE16_9NEOP|nr:hypothetical protein K1T71_014359 [Dendrolimus kikuchii]